jgi:light-harvesting protein B-800-850 alpha chain
MWLVVKPTVGLPLFIGGVALTSLIVHYAVLSHSTWYPAYLNGNQHVKTSSISAPASDSGQLAMATK